MNLSTPLVIFFLFLAYFPHIAHTQYLLCDETKFYNTVSQACESCHSSCLYCSDSAATSCYSCRDGYLSSGSCVSTCPTGYKPDTTTRKCKPCLTDCTDCPSSWYKYKTYCVQTCPEGTTLSSTTCTAVSTTASVPIIIPLFAQNSIIPIYKTLTLTPTVEVRETTTYLWTANDAQLLSGIATNFKALNIPPQNLKAGTTYRLTLSATNAYGTSKAIYDFTSGSSFTGSLLISPTPTDVTAMTTAMTFTLNNFNTNEPFFYDVVVTYEATNSLEKTLTLTKGGDKLSLVDSLVLGKGLARFQTIQSLKLPPLSTDRTVNFTLFAYNGEKSLVQTQQYRIKKQTQSQLSNTATLEIVSTISELAMNSEALNLLSPTDTYPICQRLSQATDLARYLSGESFCSAVECSSNGQCILDGSTHRCQCIGSYVGRCCSIDSSTLVGLKSGRNLYSVMTSNLNSFSVNSLNAGFIAYSLDSLSQNIEFLSSSDVNNLIESLYSFQTNSQFIDIYIAPKLYNSITNIANYGSVKYSTTEWTGKLGLLTILKNTIINSLANSLEFKEGIRYLENKEGFEAKKDIMSLVLSSSKRLLQENILPAASLLDTRLDLTSAVVVLPSFTVSAETLFSSVVYASSANVLTSDLTTYSTGFLLRDANGNPASGLVDQEVQAAIRKSIVSNATFSGLWECVQTVDGVYTDSDCRKINENFTHVLCGCTMSSTKIEMTALFNKNNGYLTRQCILESVQLYQPETNFGFLGSVTDGECFPFRFSFNGLIFAAIFFAGIMPLFNLIVYAINKNFESTKKFSEALSFIPLYSIIKAPTLPYDSRFIRANYFICHVADILGTATINREQAWTLGVNYWVQVFTTGLFIIFVLQYGTAGLWNLLYRLDFGPDYMIKKIRQRARYVIIVLCYLFWIAYFTARWGVNSWDEQKFRLQGGLALLAADLLILDPFIALLCKKFKFVRELIKFRGYYTPYKCSNAVYGTNFGDKAEPVPISAGDFTSTRDVGDLTTGRTPSKFKEYDLVVGDPRTPAVAEEENNNMKEIVAELENRL